jgi:hypothetical protein
MPAINRQGGHMPELISIYETNNSKYSIIHLIKKHPVMYSNTYSTMITRNLSQQLSQTVIFKLSYKQPPEYCMSAKSNYTLTNPSTHKGARKLQASRSLVVLLSDILCSIILQLSHKHSTLPNDAPRHTTA